MPDLVHSKSEAVLDGTAHGASRTLARTASAGALSVERVNAYVNHARHDGPRCVSPPDPELF